MRLRTLSVMSLSVLVAALLVSTACAERREAAIFAARVLTSGQQAQALIQPVDEKTPPVHLAEEGGRRLLQLPTNFSTNNEWRVAWDIKTRLDLRNAKRITLVVRPDHKRSNSLTIYFHAGDGWYRGHFYVPKDAMTAAVERRHFKPEDSPGGWHAIDRIRIAVMHREDTDLPVYLEEIRTTLGDPKVAVWRNVDGVTTERGIDDVVNRISDSLDRIGLDHEVVGDRGIERGRLADMKVAILPLNPVLSEKAVEEVRRFVKHGGRLIVCHSLPKPLDELLGVSIAGHVDGKDRALDAISYHSLKARPGVKVTQHSWIAMKIVPAKDTLRVGTWVDDAFKPGDTIRDEFTAVTKNANGFYVGHILTGEDPFAKDRLLREMIGEVWPDMWKTLYEERLGTLGQMAGIGDAQELRMQAMANAAGDGERARRVASGLTNARRLEVNAKTAADAKDFVPAYETVLRAHDSYIRAFASSVSSPEGEFHAVWCHKPEGIRGRTWDQSMKTLAGNGFGAVIVNMCWGYTAAYPSKVLPPTAIVKEQGDQLAACVAAGKKHGVAVHVWRVNWNLGWSTPEEDRRKLEADGRLQKDRDGKTITWLCPSNPVNFDLEREAMLEIVRNYDVAGIHFDYIRYPGHQGCYCDGCRRRFEAANKLTVKQWPGDVITGPNRAAWLQFRRDNITRLVAAVSAQARKIKPGVKISAAVFHSWPAPRDDIGQDWALWIEKGYLDFVCPMQYTRDANVFADYLRTSEAAVRGRIPLIPGIGATLGLSPEDTLRQVLVAREGKTRGFVLFDYQATLADDTLPLLHLGATATQGPGSPK